MLKRGGKSRNAHKRKPAGSILDDSEMQLMRNIVLKRHREWKRPRLLSHWFYLVHLLLIFMGLYMIANPAVFGLSAGGIQIAALITSILIIAFLLLLQHNIHHNSHERLEEVVEREIHTFNSERI
ncbi:MAG: hypothetical protein ABH863_00290 [Candidatus Micrarchaeota archaeon]